MQSLPIDAQSHPHKNGFTLMEMLIVIAIIAVLIAIAIPIFITQLEQAKRATDLSNMRSAYAAAAAEYMLPANDEAASKTYYYVGGSLTTTPPAAGSGYGQFSADAADIWKDAPIAVFGIPNNGAQIHYH